MRHRDPRADVAVARLARDRPRAVEAAQPGGRVAEAPEVVAERGQGVRLDVVGADRAGDRDRRLASLARPAWAPGEHEDQAKAAQRPRALGGRRLRRDELDRALEVLDAAAAELPEAHPPPLVQGGGPDRLGRRVDERDGGVDEAYRLGRVAGPGGRIRRAAEQGDAVDARDVLGIGHGVPERERAPVVPRGLGERADALGFVAGAHRRGQGAGVVAGAEPVVSDLGRNGGRVSAGDVDPALESGRERRVEAGPLARQQLVVGRLAQERVAEGEAVAARHEHVVAHRRAQRLRQLWLGEARRRGEQRVVHLATAGRGDPDNRPGVRIEGRDADEQGVAQRRRQWPGGAVRRRGHELLGEERVAVGAREDGPHQLRRRGRADDSRDLLAGLLERQRSELEALRDRRGTDVGEEAAQAVAELDLVAAMGADHEDALVPQAPREERHEVERRSVGPVEVLEREEDGTAGRRAVDPLQDARMQARDPPGGELRARRPRRGRPRRRREEAGRAVAVASVASVAGQDAQRVDDRQERDRRVLEHSALPMEHERARARDVGGELGQQPALADPRLAANEHDPGRAVGRPLERRDKLGQLRGPPGEDRARDPVRHRASIAPLRTSGVGKYGALGRVGYGALPMRPGHPPA